MAWESAPEAGEGRCLCGAPAVLLLGQREISSQPPFCVATAWSVAYCQRLVRRAGGGRPTEIQVQELIFRDVPEDLRIVRARYREIIHAEEVER